MKSYATDQERDGVCVVSGLQSAQDWGSEEKTLMKVSAERGRNARNRGTGVGFRTKFCSIEKKIKLLICVDMSNRING